MAPEDNAGELARCRLSAGERQLLQRLAAHLHRRIALSVRRQLTTMRLTRAQKDMDVKVDE
jgi:hypothetical protein